jgi:DNA polymerase elongation subunit (family B)
MGINCERTELKKKKIDTKQTLLNGTTPKPAQNNDNIKITDTTQLDKENMQATKDTQDNTTFQILDWNYYHEEDDDDGSKKYTIRLFGKTKAQESIYLQVDGFKPYFYIKLEKSWKSSQIDQILEAAQRRVFPKDKVEGLVETKVVSKYDFYGFTNYKKFNFLKMTFADMESMKAYERAFQKAYNIPWISKRPIKVKIYESNVIPFLRFMHIKDLDAVGWISIPNNKLEKHKFPPTCSKHNYYTNWKNITKVDDRNINKFIIAAFDIECTSEDGTFPQPDRPGDKVIQIGITLSRYGEDECFEKHILCLNKTDPIEGANVIWYEEEEDLLLGFTKILRELDPDIVTGYNTKGFDYQYLKRRAEYLKIYARFSRLSRINGEISEWIESTLSSSALGENKLKYYDMTGRVNIDLMKVIQRDHKLGSYKLDDVFSNFIKDTIISLVNDKKENNPNVKRKRDDMLTDFITDKINIVENDKNKGTFKVVTKNTYGLSADQYITLSYNDGIIEYKYKDGQKFKVKELTKDSIIAEGFVETEEIMGKGYKVFWSQAKDDVGPNDIFRLFKGSSADRAVVAKYCLQDCALCNKLINKLQIITNNVGMANVCNVPLSYLFLRGQGVKIFSLVAKQCRAEDHLIPTIRKKIKKEEFVKDKFGNRVKTDKEKEEDKEDSVFDKFIQNLNNKGKDEEFDDDDEDNVGYEGATVFPPEKGAHFEPIPVLDFASLYPNAMILRNLSHECFVDNPAYDNLPGYRYHEITYKSNDGTHTTCRFAEKLDGSKGIIPRILIALLAARKKYKKLMESEKDSFLRAVLDGLQQAYKVTANSLYGQTGASTSPIYMKPIAASTTATGREALQYSKYFIENDYAELINLALDAIGAEETDEYEDKKNKYMERCREIYTYYPHKIDVVEYNVDEKTNKKIKSEYQIHISTDEKAIIPDSKFIADNVEYEPKQTLSGSYANCLAFIEGNEKKNIKSNIDVLTTLGLSSPDLLCDNFLTPLSKLDSGKRKEFISNLKTNLLAEYDEENVQKLCDDNDIDLASECEVVIKQYQSKRKEDFIKALGENLEMMIYMSIWHKLGFTNIKDFENKFIKVLSESKVKERRDFINNLNAIVLDGKKLKSKFYKKHSEILEKMGYTEDTTVEVFLKVLTKLKSDTKTGFMKMLNANIDNMGYNGKDEMFEKFYEMVQQTLTGYTIKPKVIYGDTDSVFFKMGIAKDGVVLKDKVALVKAITLGIWGSIMICALLPPPMAQAYEKVLWPFAILSKKRYVGNLYEKDPNSFKEKSMGIVLKRRDNAPIVKIVCGGIVNQILNKHSAEGALNFTTAALKDIITGRHKMDKFIISKTLKGPSLTLDERKVEAMKPKEQRSYSDRSTIVHAVLADRMADRDPGNKPLSNDRIPYAFIETKKKIRTQGDRVEHPDMIKSEKLKLDYLFYITNQIMVPAVQFLGLVVENPEQVFREYIIKEENRKKCMMPHGYYFGKTEEGEQYLNIDLGDNDDVRIKEKKEKKEKKVKKNCKEKFGKLVNGNNIAKLGETKINLSFVNFDEIVEDINGHDDGVSNGSNKSKSSKGRLAHHVAQKKQTKKKIAPVKANKSFAQFDETFKTNDGKMFDLDELLDN